VFPVRYEVNPYILYFKLAEIDKLYSNSAFPRMRHGGTESFMKLFVGDNRTFSRNKDAELIIILKSRIKSE
jgi:hypothetical protein